FSSRRRHTRFDCDWSSDVCSSDLSRSLSSWTTRTASGATLKNEDAAPTERPDSFMYVSGLRSASLWPSTRISAIRAENFERQERSEERRVGKEGRSGWSAVP